MAPTNLYDNPAVDFIFSFKLTPIPIFGSMIENSSVEAEMIPFSPSELIFPEYNQHQQNNEWHR